MIVFYGDIQKLNAREKLVSFLDAKVPILCQFLHHLWDKQQRAITYKEIREAIMRGDINHAWIEDWQQDYSRFVVQTMRPLYDEMIEAATEDLKQRFVSFVTQKDYTANYSARFVTNSTEAQIMGVRAVVHRAVNLKDMSVDQLSRVIRPMVGLDQPQSLANMRYYETLVHGGMKPEKAQEKAAIYGAQQHRYRAYRIARTELAFSYNATRLANVMDLCNQGMMGHTVKEWNCVKDDRVCKYCKELDGTRLELDELFNFKTKLPRNTRLAPPAHPHCRCVLNYHEVAPPRFGDTIKPTEVSDTRHLEIVEDLADR